MASDQRKYPRIAKPLDAKWRGASGGSTCRIADISWGGCFVQTLAAPAVGEPTVVDVEIAGRQIRLTGPVVYREVAIGFAMQFDPLTEEQKEVLKDLLGAPPVST